jgi:hypothetical protein
MFLLYGVWAMCGKKCCIVTVNRRRMVMDVDGNVLHECRTTHIGDVAIYCTTGGDVLAIDPDTCKK